MSQGAYGIIAEVESHPFDMETMLFMDWRDGHTQGNEAMRASNDKTPTFLYAMPFTKNKVRMQMRHTGIRDEVLTEH